jgi:hypothetical protein
VYAKLLLAKSTVVVDTDKAAFPMIAPLTSKVPRGEEVPMPTLPLDVILNRSDPKLEDPVLIA